MSLWLHKNADWDLHRNSILLFLAVLQNWIPLDKINLNIILYISNWLFSGSYDFFRVVCQVVYQRISLNPLEEFVHYLVLLQDMRFLKYKGILKLNKAALVFVCLHRSHFFWTTNILLKVSRRCYQHRLQPITMFYLWLPFTIKYCS